MTDFVSWSKQLCQYVDSYQSLVNSYIIEFFSESHWAKLPQSWQESLKRVSLQQFCHQLFQIKTPALEYCQSNEILPLSLLAFSATANALSYPAEPMEEHLKEDNSCQLSGLGHLFRRHVKPKKQHEIRELGKTMKELCNRTGCHHVIDIGCGQGHLSRYLAYQHGLDVTAIEATGRHLEMAITYDKQVSTDIEKAKDVKSGRVCYVKQMIEPNTSHHDLMSILLPSVGEEKQHILVGLHTCGDLAITMLRLFCESQASLGLVSVGCCYMKLSENISPCLVPPTGYPISGALLGHQLCYEAKELACHSKKVYMKRLSEGFDHLKIHCWRAAVETVIRKHGLRRPQLKIPKSASKLSFKEYAHAVLQSVEINLSQDDMENMEQLIEQWQLVVIYFLLRLTMAPCIETLLLIDRVLYLQEHGFCCKLQPLFDPLLSPRNLALTAIKYHYNSQ